MPPYISNISRRKFLQLTAGVSSAYAVAPLIGRGLASRQNKPVAASSGAVASSANSQPFFDRLFTAPAQAQADLYTSLIDLLDAQGIWTTLDCLYILATSDHLTALTNLVPTGRDAIWPIQVGTFTANRGVTPLGTSFYLDTGFNPAHAGNFSQNGACLFAWNLSPTPQPGGMLGSPECHISPFDNFADDHTLWAINGAEVDSGAIANDASGFWLVNRVAPDYSSIWLNGVEIASSSVASTMPFDGTITASSDDTCQLAVIGAGGGLSEQQCQDLYQVLQTYLNSVGAL